MKKLFVHLADTPPTREKGLMGRKSLHQNEGMFFKFPSIHRLSFWMKNTYVPLDIAFIDDKGRITQIEEMVPLSTRAICSRQGCRYALEVNKGWFNRNNISVGCFVRGRGFTKKAQIDPMADILQSIPSPMDAPMDTMEQPQQDSQLTQPDPDIQLNKTIREIFMDAEARGNDVMVYYQTKAGRLLPPRTVTPPFVFESNEQGQHDAIVKGWLNQPWPDGDGPGWKSFLINNIIDVEEILKEQQLEEGK